MERKAAKVIGCVNHDANAIVSHQANHPDCLHFTEDIRTLEFTKSPLVQALMEARDFIKRLNDNTPDEATDILTNYGVEVEERLTKTLNSIK